MENVKEQSYEPAQKGTAVKEGYELKKIKEVDEEGNEREYYYMDDIVINKHDIENGADITWYSEETDFQVWFPNERNPISRFFLFRWIPMYSHDKRLTKKISKKAKPGTYYYSIFCSENDTMAEGNSSPKMIIRY